ncbi:Aste57867_9331 [Aphanomyces stellatus]|uniref:Aste57867_9331 protein n=1 Tax=Aphanomyces stellatus TaxID=120398 RepID=A0A485KMX8_9STRA|nr:hypothetical protein As57867_009295 [Aphanomyces stellatus]VFT86213.1 Aste57867_9331 [Aphanomyces stellatus]
MLRHQYELVRHLTQEGNTNIFLYRHLPSGDLVVIKKIPMSTDSIDALGDDEAAYKEMHINRILQKSGAHGAIVQLRDAFADDKVLHLVFEYCNGGDLLSKLADASKTFTSWGEDDVVPIFRQVAAAVAHLHALEIAHCDLSLENILLADHHRVKLCDFGLALSQDTMRFSGVGKLYYMSPEMHMRRPYNALAADRWAMGILLFMLLTGRPLFERAALTDPNFKIFFHAQAADPSTGVQAVLDAAQLSLSDAAVDLLTQLLRPSPKERLTMNDVLSHAFLMPKKVVAQSAVDSHIRTRSVSSPVSRLSSFPRPALARIPLSYFKSITTM